MRHEISYGIDFGTSNSAVAIVENGVPKALPIGKDGSSTVPSVIYFAPDRSTPFIGHNAITEYVSRDMRGRFIQSVKSFLPHPGFKGTAIAGAGYWSIEQLLASILTHLKQQADTLVGTDVQTAVIGKPAFFSRNPEEEETAKARLTEAARLAGFKRIVFQQEPVAAAFHYETQLTESKLVFVADLGGGTSDFTVMRLSPDRRLAHDRERDIIGVTNVYIGGDDLDSMIMRHKLFDVFGARIRYSSGNKTLPMPISMMQKICQWRTIPMLRDRQTQDFLQRLRVTADDQRAIDRLIALINENLGFALFQSIEHAKRTLSEADVAQILFSYGSKIEIDQEITRDEFNTIIGKELSDIDECIDDLLASAAITADDISVVFTTGGTSRVPAINSLLEEKFGPSKIEAGDTFLSVASGLALSADTLIRS